MEDHTHTAGAALSRRHLLGGAALAVAAVRAPDGEIPIIDTHQHLWDLDRQPLSWLKKGTGPLERSFLPADYQAAIAGLHFERSIYMEVDVPHQRAEYDREADHILGLCRAGTGFPCAAVLGGDPLAPEFRDYVTRFKGNPLVKGVRHIPPAGTPHPFTRPEFVASIRLLGELGLRFDLCVAPALLPVAAKLAEDCPGTRFILDHCGNADPKALLPARKAAAGHDGDQWRRDMDSLAKRPNVICKISGIVARADKGTWKPEDLAPTIDHCLDSFGPGRVVFGSDWPVCTTVATLREWVLALRQVISRRPAAEQRKLLRENAARWYALP